MVVVVGPPEVSYELHVTGGSCVPWLNIGRAEEEKVRLTWPSFASDYHLHATNVLEHVTNGIRVLDPILILRSEFTVTNTAPPPHRFYQLQKP
jgi:hypothetical protein